MQRSVSAIAFSGLMFAAGVAGAQQQETVVDDRWYAGVMGGVAIPGDDRLTEDTAPYYGIYIGRFFSENFSLDLQVDSYSTEFDRDKFAFPAVEPRPRFDDDFDIYGYGLTGRWHFGSQENRHRPYGLVGLGIQEHDNFRDDGRDMYVSFGAGVQSKLGDHFRLRTQFEGRYDNDRDTFDRDNGFVDFIASIGLGYSFGEPPRPPQPAPEPAPQPVRPAPPPAPAPAPPPEPEVLFEFDAAVLFDFDSAALRPEARGELDAAARDLEQHDEIILVEVAGHTDSIGTDEYNQRLSERRAQSVADYLHAQGIARERMRVRGYGEGRPKVPNTSPENRQQNRRVVISVLERR